MCPGTGACAADSVLWCTVYGDQGIHSAGDQVSKRTVLGTDAEWLAKMSQSTSIWVVLHCKLLGRVCLYLFSSEQHLVVVLGDV